MLPIYVLTGILVSQSFPCLVETREKTCVKSKRFEFVKEGFALTNHGISSLKVDSRIDCSLECTAILECKSFNFKMTESVGNNCEMNDATRHSSSPSEYKETPGIVYYEASLKGCLSSPCKNQARCTDSCSAADSSFRCDCIIDDTYGDRCEFWTANAHDFSLHFPSNDTSNFVVFDGAIQPLDEFTICLWLQTTAKDTLSIFSYGSAFYSQCIDRGKCVLGIEGNESSFYIPPLNDGNWHQLCLSRKATNGSLEIFLDGLKGIPGKGRKHATKMFLGGGQLIIGRKKTSSGLGFDGLSSFKGNISHFNIWSRWRNVNEESFSSMPNCSAGEFGDQVDWRLLKVKNGLRGDVQVNTPDTCSSISNHVNKPPSFHFQKEHSDINVTATIARALHRFTMCAWMKQVAWEQNGVVWTFAKNRAFDLFRLQMINTIPKFDVRGTNIRNLRLPLVDERSHFICSLWEGTTGRFEVMVDGRLISSAVLTKERSIDIPAESTLIIGKDFSERIFRGFISGVNIWDTFLEKQSIVALYRGNGKEGGNVVSWNGLKRDVPGKLNSRKVLNGEEHKELKSEFTLDFKTRSSQNVANHTFIFQEMVKFTACAWFKTKEQGALFQYLSTHNSTANNFHVLINGKGTLEFKVGSGAIQNVANLYLSDDQWHHACLSWTASNGKTYIYGDGQLIPGTNKTNRKNHIKGNGDFVVGQYMNESNRRFTAGLEFVGKITQVNVWDRNFEPDVFEIMSRDCSSGSHDLQWIVFRDSYHGDVQLLESSECLEPDFAVLSRRDERCNEKYTAQSLSCRGSMKALFNRKNSTSGKMWRCYHECALVKSFLDGSFVFNQTCGQEECITEAHNDLLTIT